MLGNFFSSVGRGFRAVQNYPLIVFNALRSAYSYFGVVPLLRLLPMFGTNQAVTCRARFPALHRNQTCKYVSSRCCQKGIDFYGDHVVYQGKLYPIIPLKTPDGGPVYNVQGHRLFAINTAHNNYKDFEGKIEKNKVLVVAYDGNRVVDPVQGKGSREVMLSAKHKNIYPFSFSIVNHETGQRDLVLSFLMLPLNLSGLAVGCAGRLVASVIAGVGKCCEKAAGLMSKNMDRDIIHQSSGVVTGGNKPYFRTFAVFLLSMMANSLECTASIVKNSADLSESIIRFPSGIMNGIHNGNMRCLPVTAGLAAIAQSSKSLFVGMKNSGLSLVRECVLFKARMTGDTGTLREHVGNAELVAEQPQDVQEQQGKEEAQRKKKKMSRRDLEAVKQLGESLSSQILCGTEEDIRKELTKQRKASTKTVQ
ncbi:hypothetical protein [Ehrlichia canis]|uniref:hypothetical protein n=1 Tax=Ehrlichia canis TaxID=944 RepID=UPI000C8659C9|nr:hypothetical protein [Ehrlichia canis]AUO54996.1 hypothetical protein C1I72_03955 [Ehrlichia canis]UKC53183.1 hypothetical protein s20019040002_000226 [Ehrlichia canis]UKC54120.1 hypothetical protein s20026770001_000226 [Ehrlichia canis]UKC55056.1 hypothetical protein s21009500007_000226 [Ehrlichia canis]